MADQGLTLKLDVAKVKSDFPIFSKSKYPKLVYLDSAATSQKPRSVIDSMSSYYETTHANVHRGVYSLAEDATRAFEDARIQSGRFVNAEHPSREIVFTKNATEAFNLLSNSLSVHYLKPGDSVVLTLMEHHANVVPWLMLKERLGINLKFMDIDQNGELILDDIDELLRDSKLLSLTMTSNVLGTVPPFKFLVEKAHEYGLLTILDAAQFAPHKKIDVIDIDADFLIFTGHKIFGPTGIGVLYGKQDLLESMPPFLGGGEMIRDVKIDGFTPNEIPWKFEAGTPPIAEAVGLKAGIEYLESLDYEAISEHETALLKYMIDSLQDTFAQDIAIHGPRNIEKRSGLVSFSLNEIHPHDIAQVLDEYSVCVRAGHHCAKPLMRHLCVSATTRASISCYNDFSDIDALIDGLKVVTKMFK